MTRQLGVSLSEIITTWMGIFWNRFILTITLITASMQIYAATPGSGKGQDAFVRVSPADSWYFELSDGTPYIPIGLNMIAPPGREGMPGMEKWMKSLSDNGGNFIRIWLSNPYFDVEHQRSGEYDEEKARRIDELLVLARKYGIRLKFCIEHFRHLGEGSQTWAGKPLHKLSNGGTAANIADFFDGQASRDRFIQKLAWYAKRYGNHPQIFGWELWNEINAVQGGKYMEWSEFMLSELHRLFPSNLCMQSLGSYDSARWDPYYNRLALMPGNDVAQVHRYLDLGASLDVCNGPVDILADSAVGTLRSAMSRKNDVESNSLPMLRRDDISRPVLLAESGAVEPNHSGPFKLYATDTNGMMLHDVLFAPFFSGAAGPGHIWHWDAYVSKNNLWWHFGRFAEVVTGLNPSVELFRTESSIKDGVRIRTLFGKTVIYQWCRDTNNTWKTELEQGIPPGWVKGLEMQNRRYGNAQWKVQFYDPWENRWTQGDMSKYFLILPDFRRSIVVKYERIR